MSGSGPRFDPTELVATGKDAPGVVELSDATLVARDLEAFADATAIRPSEGFEDRIMAAVALEPTPRVVVRRPSSVRGGVFGSFLVTVREAWMIATTGGRPIVARAQAVALVVIVALAAGLFASVTVAGVGALIGPSRTPAPSVLPDPSSQPTPAPTPSPSVSPEGSSPSPSATPEATETQEATETPDDDGGSTRATAQPDSTGKAHGTPEPDETAEPTKSPKPGETPRATDDHGSGG